MQMLETPPRDWDARIEFPTLSRGFAEAAATVGHRPLYAIDDDASALILVRALPVPVFSSWTARAKVHVSRGNARFVSRLVEGLAAQGIAQVRIGDGVWGLSRHIIEAAGLSPAVTHLLEHAPAESDQELFDRLQPKRRSSLRRAEREGVVVSEVRSEAELEAYCTLAGETERRARARDVGTVMPGAYFRAIFRTMVPRKQAVIFLARQGEWPLSGAIFLTSRDRMTYFRAASTRDPELVKRQGPTAVIWHALRVARARQIPRFDLGAVTPTDDTTHPSWSVYRFKREFGGYVTELHHAEVTLSPAKVAFQEHVMLPVWKRAHGFYMTAFGTRSAVPQEAASGTDLRWAGVPAKAPATVAPGEPWDVDAVIDEIRALGPIRVRAVELSEQARMKAVAFAHELHGTVAREAARPILAATVDGGICFSWPASATGSGQLVELVFFRDVIEYAVVDGTDVTAAEQRLLDGETSDVGAVIREVVKRYVVRV